MIKLPVNSSHDQLVTRSTHCSHKTYSSQTTGQKLTHKSKLTWHFPH